MCVFENEIKKLAIFDYYLITEIVIIVKEL